MLSISKLIKLKLPKKLIYIITILIILPLFLVISLSSLIYLYEKRSKILYKIEPILNQADHIIVSSKFMRDHLMTYFNNKYKIDYMYLGVEKDEKFTRKEARNILKKYKFIMNDTFVILNGCQNIKKSRFDILIKSFAKLLKKNPGKPIVLFLLCQNNVENKIAMLHPDGYFDCTTQQAKDKLLNQNNTTSLVSTDDSNLLNSQCVVKKQKTNYLGPIYYNSHLYCFCKNQEDSVYNSKGYYYEGKKPLATFIQADTSLNIKSNLCDMGHKHTKIMLDILYDNAKTIKGRYKSFYKDYRGIAKKGFDVINSQFSFHYYFEYPEFYQIRIQLKLQLYQ